MAAGRRWPPAGSCPPRPLATRRFGVARGLAQRGARRLPALPAAGAAVGLLSLLAAPPAAACAVCMGAAESASMQGLQAGILLLLGMVGLVFAGVGAFVFAARRRLQRLRLHGGPTEALQR